MQTGYQNVTNKSSYFYLTYYAELVQGEQKSLAENMEPIQKDFIKALLQVAHKLTTNHGIAKETIAHIIGDYVESLPLYRNM